VRSLSYVGLALVGAVACASGPAAGVADALRRGQLAAALAAYERGAPDLATLRRIAEATLEREAQSHERARRAQVMAELEVSGTAAERVLRRLATRAIDPATRAHALALLARHSDAAARAALRAKLGDVDSDVRAAAIEALDSEADAATLRVLCEAPSAAVRLAAVQKLARASDGADDLLLLTRVARLDPALPVRVAALYGLGRRGKPAVPAIEAQLDAAEPVLRLAAVSDLVQADAARAVERLERYLADNPTPEGIEAARALLSADPTHAPAAARVQLERALADRDGALRAAAAVALMSLRDPRLRALAAERAEHEAVRSVRLCLALALGATTAGHAMLVQLTAAQDVVSAQAAAELARARDATGLRRLRALRQSRAPAVRRIAARALARDPGHAHEVRAALLDADASVRIAVAGAMLVASAASG
jgi:HEAT repeat protein